MNIAENLKEQFLKLSYIMVWPSQNPKATRGLLKIVTTVKPSQLPEIELTYVGMEKMCNILIL